MNSIPQNLRNVLKNRIKILINPILYNLIDFTVDNLFVENAENMYFSLFYNIQSSTRKLIRQIIISTFEEIDEIIKLSAFIGDLNYFMDKSAIYNIPRQSVYNWIKEWSTPNVIPTSIETPETLYVMADEKYIGAQDIEKDIMIKSFVTFEDVKQVSKNRNALVNRFVFSCYSSSAWPSFMDCITKRYDFSKIKNIALLSDGGSWIKSGINELKLDPNNNVKFYLCEFHFKQAINNITSDEDKRKELLEVFTNKSKKEFITVVNNIIENDKNREEIITKKLNYILNNYPNIKAMLDLNIGSSMESHISHLIASFFSSRPKGFSTKRIEQYLKLNDYKNFSSSAKLFDSIALFCNSSEIDKYTYCSCIIFYM